MSAPQKHLVRASTVDFLVATNVTIGHSDALDNISRSLSMAEAKNSTLLDKVDRHFFI